VFIGGLLPQCDIAEHSPVSRPITAFLNTNQPKGRAWSQTFGAWLQENEFDQIKESARGYKTVWTICQPLSNGGRR
jgi:hypothetical protein